MGSGNTKLIAERKMLNQGYLALKEEVKEAEKIRKSVYGTCGRNSGNSKSAENRIWSGNRQGGGGIVNAYHHRPVFVFYQPDKLKSVNSSY